MKQVVFDQPTLNLKVSTHRVYEHTVTGLNLSSNIIKVLYMSPSCSCLTYEPLDIVDANKEFSFKIYINKVGLTGRFSVSLTINFDNGQKEVIRISGEILQ